MPTIPIDEINKQWLIECRTCLGAFTRSYWQYYKGTVTTLEDIVKKCERHLERFPKHDIKAWEKVYEAFPEWVRLE